MGGCDKVGWKPKEAIRNGGNEAEQLIRKETARIKGSSGFAEVCKSLN